MLHIDCRLGAPPLAQPPQQVGVPPPPPPPPPGSPPPPAAFPSLPPLSVLVLVGATITTLAGSFIAFMLYLRPVLAAAERAAAAAERAASEMEAAAQEMEKAAKMMQEDMPLTFQDMQRTSKECEWGRAWCGGWRGWHVLGGWRPSKHGSEMRLPPACRMLPSVALDCECVLLV